MPEITRITSEALQATVRRLLPSQLGFGTDLEALNTIVPIVDLTPTAEGSQLPSQLQNAFSFVDQTAFFATASSVATIANTPGFYKVTFQSTVIQTTAFRLNKLYITDGATEKNVWYHNVDAGGINGEATVLAQTHYYFLRQGDTLKAECSSGSDNTLYGSSRPVADVYGNLINPGGFTFE